MTMSICAEAYKTPLPGLTSNEILLLRSLCWLASKEARSVTVYNDEIGSLCNWSEPATVSRLLTRLENKGYITRKGAPLYRVIHVIPSEEWPGARIPEEGESE